MYPRLVGRKTGGRLQAAHRSLDDLVPHCLLDGEGICFRHRNLRFEGVVQAVNMKVWPARSKATFKFVQI